MIACPPVLLASRHPTDLELIKSHLLPRITSGDSGRSCGFINHADVYAAHPAELTTMFLPAKSVDGEEAWYFFSPVKTKSLRGQRKARTVKSGAGCWHSEAGTKPVLDVESRRVGHRQFFSFVTKDDGKRIRTGWLMVELRLDRERERNAPSEDLVLCKIYVTPRASTSTPAAQAVVADHTVGDKRKDIDDSPDEAPPVRRCCHSLPEATAANNVAPDVMEEDEEASPAPGSPSTPTSSSSASPPSSPASSSSPTSASPPSPASSMSPTTPPPLSSMSQPTRLSSPPEQLSSSSVAAQDEAVTVPARSSTSTTRTVEQAYFVLPSLDYSRQEVYVICRGDCSLTHKITRGDCRVTFAVCKGDCHT